MRERKSQAAIDAEREAGPEGRRRDSATPTADPHEPSNTEKKFRSSHTYLHSRGVSSVSRREVRRILISG